MSLFHKIAQNTLAHAVGRLAGIAISIATVALMTRYLGQSGFGTFSTITAFIQFASVIGGLGLYLITLRMLGDPEKNPITVFSNILSLRIASSLTLVVILSLCVWFLPYPRIVHIGILLFSLTVVSNAIDQIAVAGMQKYLSVARTALAEISGKSVILISVMLTAHYDGGLMAIIGGYVVGNILHMSINLHRVRAFIPFRLTCEWALWKQIIHTSLPLAMSNIFVIIYFKADTLFLSIYRTPEEVGIYSAPYQALETLISFAPMFMGLVLPHLSEKRFDGKAFSMLFQKAFDGLWIIACWLMATVIALATPITLFIAGSEFATSAPIFRILIIATAIIYLAHLTTYAITALDQQKKMLRYFGIAACGAIIGYTLFIPLYSYWAAAFITVAVEFFIFVTSYTIVKKNIPLEISFATALKSFVAASATGIILWLLRELPIMATLPASLIIYCVFLLLSKTISVDNLKKIFRQRTAE